LTSTVIWSDLPASARHRCARTARTVDPWFSGGRVVRVGYDASEIVGLPMNTVVPVVSPREAERAEHRTAGAARRVGREKETCFARRKDGSNLPVEVVLSSMDGVD